MPKKKEKKNLVSVPVEQEENFYPYSDKESVLQEVQDHYQEWNDDNEHRRTREGGWDDVTESYWGKLPEDWPFISRTNDPRIRTSLIEKNARLTKNRLKGKVLPREGGDILKARINNTLIEYQWDTANHGGTMQQKISDCDMSARLYASKFAYVWWRTAYKGDKLVFDGNEMTPISKDDCGMDNNCDHVKSAKWFQHRIWMLLQDIEANKEMYPGYEELKRQIDINKNKRTVNQQRRDSKYSNKVREIVGIEDKMGQDSAFPVVEIVVEYRNDKWITFSPAYNTLLSISDNPYEHGRIPVSQLRYYPVEGDNLGESEVEAVLPLWRAIQAIICSYMDEVILKMRPPLKVVEGAARIETIVYQPEAMWLVDNPNAITEMQSNGEAVRYFQATYPVLVSAFNTAMGDMSQGVSNLDGTQAEKSATEVRQLSKQQNTRDQKNQQELSEFIKDIVSMWIANNKQFLFRNPDKKEHILRIIGDENFSYFQRSGLDEMIIPDGAEQELAGIIQTMTEDGQGVSDAELQAMVDAVKIPKYPVIENPEEQDDSKLKVKSKMRVNELGDAAELSLVPADLDGSYDYIPDMKSMEASANDQLMFARNTAFQTLVNPNVIALLAQQGYKPLIKDVLVTNFEDMGINDANKYFEQVQELQQPGQPGAIPPEGSAGVSGSGPNITAFGVEKLPQANSSSSVEQQMARPSGVQ